MKLENYYLDLKTIIELDKDKMERIIDIHSSLVSHIELSNHTISIHLMNTLVEAGYLKNARTKKIDNVLKED